MNNFITVEEVSETPKNTQRQQSVFQGSRTYDQVW